MQQHFQAFQFSITAVRPLAQSFGKLLYQPEYDLIPPPKLPGYLAMLLLHIKQSTMFTSNYLYNTKTKIQQTGTAKLSHMPSDQVPRYNGKLPF